MECVSSFSLKSAADRAGLINLFHCSYLLNEATKRCLMLDRISSVLRCEIRTISGEVKSKGDAVGMLRIISHVLAILCFLFIKYYMCLLPIV